MLGARSSFQETVSTSVIWYKNMIFISIYQYLLVFIRIWPDLTWFDLIWFDLMQNTNLLLKVAVFCQFSLMGSTNYIWYHLRIDSKYEHRPSIGNRCWSFGSHWHVNWKFTNEKYIILKLIISSFRIYIGLICLLLLNLHCWSFHL